MNVLDNPRPTTKDGGADEKGGSEQVRKLIKHILIHLVSFLEAMS